MTRHRLESQYRRNAHVIAYVILVAGIVVALWMIQTEERNRTEQDRAITTQLATTDRARIRQNGLLIKDLRRQVHTTQRINRIQNQILRALLAAERRDPEIFGGEDLPRLNALLDETAPPEVGAARGGEKTTRSKTRKGRSGKVRNPKARTGRGPKRQ